jgi:negative regulator of replication initiation
MRDRVISFRVTDEEYDFIKARAEKGGDSVSGVLRRLVKHYEVSWVSPGVMTVGSGTYTSSNPAVIVWNGGNVHG